MSGTRNMVQKHRRKRLWVDPPFQARLLKRLVVYAVLYFLILGHADFVLEMLPRVAAGGGETFGGLYLSFLGRHQAAIFCALLLTPAMLYDMLRFSHRMAGPLCRLRRYLRDMAEGRPVPQFTLRDHDLPRDLIDAFNEMARTWNERVAGGPPAQEESHQDAVTTRVPS
jgi:hypothetical protein